MFVTITPAPWGVRRSGRFGMRATGLTFRMNKTKSEIQTGIEGRLRVSRYCHPAGTCP